MPITSVVPPMEATYKGWLYGATGCILVAVLSLSCADIPSDRKLERTLRRHTGEFQELLAMAKTDERLTTISPEAILTPGRTVLLRGAPPGEIENLGLSTQRWSRYQELFSALDLPGGVTQANGEVWFRAGLYSISDGATIKGFVYSPHELKPCVADLDKYVPSSVSLDSHGGFVVYKHLQGPWYLFRHRS